MNRVLLIQTAFIGDVILTTPMIRAFKRFFPGTKLTVMVKPQAVSLLKDNPDIDEILVLDKGKKGKHRGVTGIFKMGEEIRAKKFDVLLAVHQSHRTGFLSYLSGIPERHGYETAGFAKFAYTHLHKRDMQQPEIIRLLAFLEDSLAKGASEESKDLLLYENDASKKEATNLLESLSIKKPFLVAPSSVWPTKRWTPWGFAKLCRLIIDEYKTEILLVGAREDREIAQEVLGFVKILLPERYHSKIEDVCGKTSLMGLYSLMKRSSLLVSNDSAPVHIACAAKIPVVSIFGPTTTSLGFAPLTVNSTVAQIDLPCRPCGLHGSRKCPLGHFRCMKELDEHMVFHKVKEVYNYRETEEAASE